LCPCCLVITTFPPSSPFAITPIFFLCHCPDTFSCHYLWPFYSFFFSFLISPFVLRHLPPFFLRAFLLKLYSTMTDIRMSLFCLVDEEATSNAFSVKISSDNTVDDLKNLIKAKKTPRFDDVAADELTLWRVSVPI